MQGRAMTTQSILKFQLFSHSQYVEKSAKFVDSITTRGPAIAHQVCLQLGLTASTIEIQFLNETKGGNFGAKFTINAYSKTGLSDFADAKICDAITKAVDLVDRERLFGFENKYSIEFSDKTLDQSAPALTWKVDTINYSHNALDALSNLKVALLDESNQKYSANSHSKVTKIDRWGNLIAVKYERRIAKDISDELFERLLTGVRNYIFNKESYASILKSIEEKNFNQAFRRACFIGDQHLVNMFFEYDHEGELNIDINSSSTNGKTPLDYAVESKNESLIKLLKINGAKTRADQVYLLEDLEHKSAQMLKLEGELKRRNQSQRNSLFDSFGLDHELSGVSDSRRQSAGSRRGLEYMSPSSTTERMVGSRLSSGLANAIDEQNRRQREEAMFRLSSPGERPPSSVFGSHSSSATSSFTSSSSSLFGRRDVDRGSIFDSGSSDYDLHNPLREPSSSRRNGGGFVPPGF